ncbi:MAG: HDIG domain-containing protein [Phycisphaerales bacterium]
MVRGPNLGRSPARGRRTRLKRKLPRPTSAGLAWLRVDSNIHALLVALAFVAAGAALVAWSRDLPRAFSGQIATASKVNRLEYTLVNEALTEQRRADARKAAPRVYDMNVDYVERVRSALDGLPQLVRDKTDLSEMQPEVVERYGLTPSTFQELRLLTSRDGGVDWRIWSERLLRNLTVGVPLVANTDFEAYSTAVKRVLLTPADPVASAMGLRAIPLGRSAIEVRGEAVAAMRPRLVGEAVEAGFPDSLARVAVAPLLRDPQPTINFNAEATKRVADEAARGVLPVVQLHPRGEAVFVEGDQLTDEQVVLNAQEELRYAEWRGMPGYLERAGGAAGLASVLALLVLTYAGLFDRALYRDWRKLAVIFALVLLPAVLAAPTSWFFPRTTVLGAVGASLFATGILTIVYGVRTALLVVVLQAALLVLALGNGVGFFVADVAGCTVFALWLRDIRQRATLVTASLAAALAAGLAMAVHGFFTAPGGGLAVRQILTDAVGALLVAFFVGFVLMGLLPTIERVFGTVTGLTLSELRDPKQPLLRELQRLAPGTWNHSLQIANIAEAAADSIGADGLLVYVGALYHDIGKMNKPEYFVENQTGVNRHDRLSPAMSLLVIVGHVKDGLELAAEYGLPRQVRQFIQTHHGTTLVEYFYQAAQRRAGADEVNEADFRYPGPKPQTKEAAVLMLSDAVESASRTLSEPTPARIEQLVRDLSHRRLVDGQFDESTLTFRELRAVEDSIIKSLNAIYHGRISYPSQRSELRDQRASTALPKVAG